MNKKFKGIPIVSGKGIGKAHFLGGQIRITPERSISREEIGNQIILFNNAREKAKESYNTYISRIKKSDPFLQQISIINTYIHILDDPAFIGEVIEFLSTRLVDLETAIRKVEQDFIARFETARTTYLRERGGDIVEVCEKLVHSINSEKTLKRSSSPLILIVPRIFIPSDILEFDIHSIKGIIALNAGHTSHASILARTHKIPLVSGVKHLVKHIHAGDDILVNGYEGSFYINPEASLIRSLRTEQSFHKKIRSLSLRHTGPVRTKDGVPIPVLANIAFPEDLELAHAYGADGIGLVRSEFLYYVHDHVPTVGDQQQYFLDLFEKAAGKKMVIRLLDIGADKLPPHLKHVKETNPFMGWRGIRVLLKNKHFFREHLTALMKAAGDNRYTILLPMITTLNEWKDAKTIINATAEALHVPLPQCGILIEVPLTLLEIENFISHVDFLSLGTNDLIQYLSAADRNNPNVAHLYNPIEPAFLRILRNTVRIAAKAQKPISICGEMGGLPLYTVLLLGLGLQRFSMVPQNIPIVKEIISQTSFKEASEIVENVLVHCSPDTMPKRIVSLNKKALKKSYDRLEGFLHII